MTAALIILALVCAVQTVILWRRRSDLGLMRADRNLWRAYAHNLKDRLNREQQ